MKLVAQILVPLDNHFETAGCLGLGELRNHSTAFFMQLLSNEKAHFHKLHSWLKRLEVNKGHTRRPGSLSGLKLQN